MAKNKKAPAPGETPAWKAAQQKETAAKDTTDHTAAAAPAEGKVRIKMKTDYRDVAKAGQVWETDAGKAKELVELGRAEYVR